MLAAANDIDRRKRRNFSEFFIGELRVDLGRVPVNGPALGLLALRLSRLGRRREAEFL